MFGSGGFAQIARGVGPAVEMDDFGCEFAAGIGGDGDALARAEQVDLCITALGAVTQIGRVPFGGGECDGVSGCLGRGVERTKEQQGSEYSFWS